MVKNHRNYSLSRKRKALLGLVFLIAIISCTYLFHHSWICFGMEKYLSSKFPSQEKMIFSYESLRWKKGSLCFHKVTIDQEEKKEGEKPLLKIEEIEMVTHCSLFPFRFSFSFIIDHPCLAVTKSLFDQTGKEKPITPLFSRYLRRTALEIKRGEVVFEAGRPFTLFFSARLKGEWEKSTICISDTKDFIRTNLCMQLTPCGKQVAVNLAFDHFSICHFSSLVSFFSPRFVDRFHIHSGYLEGTYSFQYGAPFFTSSGLTDLHVHQFHLTVDTYDMDFTIEEMRWKNVANQQKEGKESPLLGKKIANCFWGGGEIHGASLCLHDPMVDEPWVMQNLEGTLQANAEGELFVHLTEDKRKADPLSFVELTLQGGRKGESGWKVNVDLQFAAILQKAVKAHFQLDMEKDRSCSLALDCQNLTSKQIKVVKQLLTIQFPALKNVEVSAETLDMSVTGRVEKGKFSQCVAKHVWARSFSLSYPAVSMQLSAGQLQGNGKCDFTFEDFFEGSFWECIVDRGRIESRGLTILDSVNGRLAMEDRYVKPSQILASIGEIDTTIKVEGLLNHLHIGIDLTIIPNDFLELLGLPPTISIEEKEKWTFQWALHCKRVEQQLHLDGAVDLLRIKGKNDHAEFGFIFREIGLRGVEEYKKELQQSLQKGYFQAENLSDKTLNLGLYILGQDWHGTGTVNVQGTFTPDTIFFDIDPSCLCYHSSYITASYDKDREKEVPSCQFSYDRKTKRWKGEIPLSGAEITLHPFSLVFENFNANLIIEEEKIFSNQWHARTNDVSFTGEIEVDYHFANYTDLHLDVQDIKGPIEGVKAILSHFALGEYSSIPLSGELINGKQGLQLYASFGEVSQLHYFDFSLLLKEGKYLFSPLLSFDHLHAKISYASRENLLLLENVKGVFQRLEEKDREAYGVNIPIAAIDFSKKCGTYDMRVEVETHDICRFKGSFTQKGTEYFFHIDPNWSHFLGARGNISTLVFDQDWHVSMLDMEAVLSPIDLHQQLEFFSQLGIFPIPPLLFSSFQPPHFEEKLALSCHYNHKEETFSLKAKADKFTCGSMHLDQLTISAKRVGDLFHLEQCRIGEVVLTATMERQKDVWAIPFVDFYIGEKKILQGRGGKWEEKNHLFTLPLEQLKIEPGSFLSCFFSVDTTPWESLVGTLFFQGDMALDYSQGIKEGEFRFALKLNSEGGEGDPLHLSSSAPFYLTWSIQKGLRIESADFSLSHPNKDPIWAKCALDTLSFCPDSKEWNGKNIHLVIPPEMVYFLAEKGVFPSIGVEGKSLLLFSMPINWHNQLKTTLDFTFGKTFQVKGSLAEGYYWVGEQSCQLQNGLFSFEEGEFSCSFLTQYREMPFAFSCALKKRPQWIAKLTVAEVLEEGKASHPLQIQTAWSTQEGFFIQNINGSCCGLDFSFHHNPKDSFLDQMALTGQVKINVPILAKLFPEEYRKVVQNLGIGKGYELSGDLIFSKENWTSSYFVGYLKGKHFELFGSELETLLSHIALYPNHVELTDFSLSDAAGIFSMKQLRLEATQKGKWQFAVPQLSIQDFRPSLIKKIGSYRGRIKPLTIRKLYCYNMRGELGNMKSITGRGDFHFINTFKRDYNLLDIPLEIIGRLGLDLGLLVPVRGKLDYVLADGKVHFIELTDSYSEGQRSQFFLSSSEPSYVDFEGNLSINIRMKQYVLLKLTEPFTLSITGTFENPHHRLW